MDELTPAGSRAKYGLSYNLHICRTISIPRLLQSRLVLVLAIALAGMAFLSIGSNTTQHSSHESYLHRFDAPRSWSSPLRSLGSNVMHRFTSWSTSHSEVVSPYAAKSGAVSSAPRYRTLKPGLLAHPVALRTDASCASDVEDFVEDREVGTGDCNGGRLCRARVVVTKHGSSITIQAGYNIFYRNGVIDINGRTKRNVKAVKRSEANAWATSLLKLLKPTLQDLNCDVTVKMISDAIMATKNDAARCPRTDNALCTQMKTIKTCAAFEPLPFETENQAECGAFLASDVDVSSLEDLISKSACHVHSEANQVFMNVPLCTTTCTVNGCAHEKLIYADLDISGIPVKYRWDGSNNERTRNSIATVYVSLFNALLAPNIPSCDDMGYYVLDDDFFQVFQLLVATHEGTADKSRYKFVIPPAIQQIAAQNDGAKVLDIRYSLPMGVSSYIESQCMIAE